MTSTTTLQQPAETITLASNPAKPTSSSTTQYPDLTKYPKLTHEQAGHLRHFHNLATQPDNEWRHMSTQEPLQEFLDAYRYQLATMAYAVGVTHYHRQPLLRGPHKKLIRQLIHKMLLRGVWAYWFTTSLGGVTTNPDLKELRAPWADPVVRENIMYSGHLLLMTSLYGMLFADDEFEKSGSIVFDWNPMFYGLGPERFEYDNGKLQAAILKEMEANGWIGVCCEPNAVFVVCNQFPLIAMRYRDILMNTDIASTTLEKYQAAWASKRGLVHASGLMPDMWLVQQDMVLPASDPGWTAWAAAFMNTWNSTVVRENFAQQILGFITSIDGEVRLHPPILGTAIRLLVQGEQADPTSKETLQRAKEALPPKEQMKKPRFPFTKPMFGYVVQWLSEMGKTQLLDGLLAYADKHLSPQWENGGLFYPRHDVAYSPEFEWTHMDPFSGNAAIGYARLNVEDGQKAMWEKPWTVEKVRASVFVDGVGFEDGVDFLRGVWDQERRLAVVTMRSWDAKPRTVRPIFRNLEAGRWVIWIDGEQRSVQEVGQRGEIRVEVVVGGDEVDVLVVRDSD